MKGLNFSVDSDSAYIVPIGDTHIGDPGFVEDKLRSYINWILEREHCYVMLLGDIFETPVSGGRSTNTWLLPDGLSPVDAERKAVELFEPIASRIIGIVEGNHEKRATQLVGVSSLTRLTDALGLADYYDRKMVKTRLKVNEQSYNIVATHGWGGARLVGGQLNKAISMGRVTADADVYLTGHEHSLLMARQAIDLEREGIELRQVYVGCGCFVEWTEFQQGMQITKPGIGAPRIRFDGTRRDVHVSI